MCSRPRSVAANRRSDQLRDLVSSQLVPAVSDMSDTASPTNHRRTKSSGNSTLSIRLNKSGPLRFTQTSLGAVNPGNTIYPLIDRKDGSESSSDASTSARVSFYKIDGRRAFSALSTSVAPCLWPERPIPLTPDRSADTRNSRITLSTAVFQVSGSCNVGAIGR